ncbi:hypothetical protein ZWY2020_030358 [Hordeum vulgare]|nr:hypothetical protein ZWY2020_030358 [Hordeum vulgare]
MTTMTATAWGLRLSVRREQAAHEGKAGRLWRSGRRRRRAWPSPSASSMRAPGARRSLSGRSSPRPLLDPAPPAAGRLCSGLTHIAISAFTLGTVALLPFYMLMIAAPNANITKRLMESTASLVALGILYAYMLHLSWTPDTIRAMFASKQVYHDGIKNNIETRHSVSLCLIFCPIGIAAHALTKV